MLIVVLHEVLQSGVRLYMSEYFYMFELSATVGFPEFYISIPETDVYTGFSIPEQFDGKCRDRNNSRPIPNDSNRSSHIPLHPQAYHPSAHDQGSESFKSCNLPQNIVESAIVGKDLLPLKHNRIGHGHRDMQPPLPLTKSNVDQLIPNKPTRELGLDMEDLDIPWSDLVLKEKIGSGIYPLL